MLITVYTETVIDYAHYLRGYEGNCKNLHGHSGLIRLWIKGDESQLNETGMLFDFNNIKSIKEQFDHKCLNECSNKDIDYKNINPTAENLCLDIYRFFKNRNSELQFKVRFYETSVGKKTYAEVGDF